MRLYVDAVRRATYPVTFALTRSGVPFPKAFNEARILVHDNAGKGL